MKKTRISIQESPIHRFGIYADEPIECGQLISELKGSKVVYKSSVYGQSNRYTDWFGIGKNTWIDPVDEFQYLNHSCNPSAGLMGKSKLKLYARRDIKAGDEITIDYSTTEEDPGFCFENSEPEHPLYRRFIGPIQTLPVAIYLSYLPYIPEYFKSVYEKEVLISDTAVLESKLK